jgi:hypothetical protein
MPRKKINPRVKRPKADAELNPISVWKNPATHSYGLAIYMHKTRAYYDTEREFTGPQIDAIRAMLKKEKRKLTLDGDWKPYLRQMGVHI